MEGVWRVCAGCVESAWRVHGGSVERHMEGAQRVLLRGTRRVMQRVRGGFF